MRLNRSRSTAIDAFVLRWVGSNKRVRIDFHGMSDLHAISAKLCGRLNRIDIERQICDLVELV